LAGERARHDHTSRSDESVRLAEVRALHIADEVVAEVGAIGQVESLEDQLQARLVAELNVLADTQVELEERVSAQVVERRLETIARSDTSLKTSRIQILGRQQIIGIVLPEDHMRRADARAEAEDIAPLRRRVAASRR